MRYLSMRVLVLALFATVGGSWLLQRVELVYGGPALATGPLPPLPLVLLSLVVLASAILGRWLSFNRRELLALYLLLAVALPLASTGWAQYLLAGLVTGPYSYADESQRFHAFLKHIPSWMTPDPSDSMAVDGFFEGAAVVPWHSWIAPLLAWSVLVAGLFAAFLGLVMLLHRRWIDEEHLRFPLTEVPLEVIERGGVLLRQKAFWLGVSVPVILFGVNGINHFFLIPGEIAHYFDLRSVLIDDPWKAMAPFESRFVFYFSPMLVGLSYLLSVEVSFSTWFFFLGGRVQLLYAELIGRADDHGSFVGLGAQWREWPNFFPHLQAQARGALLTLAVFYLWRARHACVAAAREGKGAWLLFGGFALMVFWGVAAGLPVWLSGLYFSLLLLTTVGMMRLRLDTGLPVTAIYFLTGNLFFFFAGSGPGVFSRSEYVALAFLTALNYTGIGAIAMLQFEGFKMASVLKTGRHGVVTVLGLGVVLGLVAGMWSLLSVVYEHGLFTLDQQGGGRSVARLGRYYHYLYAEVGTRAAGTDWDRLAAIGFGGAAAAVLSFLRLVFLRFPFHPAGFVYGTGLGTLLWGSALVGWSVKMIVVRYGGAGTYHRVRPFFMGLIFGELGSRILWGLLSLRGDTGGGYDWW